MVSWLIGVFKMKINKRLRDEEEKIKELEELLKKGETCKKEEALQKEETKMEWRLIKLDDIPPATGRKLWLDRIQKRRIRCRKCGGRGHEAVVCKKNGTK
jgi:hypothetical protein